MNIFDNEDDDTSSIGQPNYRENPPAQVPINTEVVHNRVKKTTEIPVVINPMFNLDLLFQVDLNPDSPSKMRQNPPPPPAPALPPPARIENQLKSLKQQNNEQIDKMQTLIKVVLDSPQRNYLENLPQILPSLSHLSCPNCKNLAIQVKLECKHPTCAFCLQSNVKNLIEKPSIEALKRCRCPTCLVLFKSKDLEKVLANSGSVQNFENLEIKRKCLWCKRALNACKDFFTELDCMHLCGSCYTNELYLGSRACMVCEKAFEKKEVTLKRRGSCFSCGNQDFIVKGMYRALHKDHLLCFNCLHNSVYQNPPFWCKCGESIDKAYVLVTKIQLNKECSKCTQIRTIDEIRVCPHCCFIQCFNCVNGSNCGECGKNFY